MEGMRFWTSLRRHFQRRLLASGCLMRVLRLVVLTEGQDPGAMVRGAARILLINLEPACDPNPGLALDACAHRCFRPAPNSRYMLRIRLYVQRAPLSISRKAIPEKRMFKTEAAC